MANKAIFVNLYWEYFVNIFCQYFVNIFCQYFAILCFEKYYVNFNLEYYLNIFDNILSISLATFSQFFWGIFWQYFLAILCQFLLGTFYQILYSRCETTFKAKSMKGFNTTIPGKVSYSLSFG